MATARKSSAAQIMANEGHVGEVMLLGAVDSVFDLAAGPLSTAQIAATLSEQGYPTGNSRLLREDIRLVLRKHPESFSNGDGGWSRQDPRRTAHSGLASPRRRGQQ